MVLWLTALLRAPRILVVSIAVAAALLGIAGLWTHTPVADAASSKYLMCNWTVEERTQTVYIDPSISRVGVSKAQVLAAFESWNKLFVKYHGIPAFAEHKGSAATADVVIDARSFDRTWVDGVCNRKYVSRGVSHTTVYLGTRDKHRNADIIAHELGHALGLADHGDASKQEAGHIGYKPCGNYYGVMSYCTSSQTWFMDIEAKGLYLDGQLVRDYWK
jgi:hypothetical protein